MQVFFPVCRSEHIFVLVFNLKNQNIVILDNSISDTPVEDKYGPVLNNLVSTHMWFTFYQYLSEKHIWFVYLLICDLNLFLLKFQKKYLVRYLHEIKHCRAYVMADPQIPVILQNMTWKTKKNKTDCGVFAMRHMETYMGEPDGSYKCGIVKEGLPQEMMLEKMRSKYVWSLLMSDLNVKREEIMEHAKTYSQLPEEQRKKHAFDACMIIRERLTDAM